MFISHSTADREDVVNLGHSLRAALKSQIRIFNTSDFSIEPGTRWRDRILAAIRDSSMVILWATPNALESKEVAFEIGAAFAYEKQIIPCCVHVPASKLPWSLSEIQAHTLLDQKDGWLQLGTTVANLLNLPVAIDKEPLLAFAVRFQATSKALELGAVGMTVEIRNVSTSPVSHLDVSVDGGSSLPEWTSAFDETSMAAGETKMVLRASDEVERRIRLSWTDVVGVAHTRDVILPPTPVEDAQ